MALKELFDVLLAIIPTPSFYSSAEVITQNSITYGFVVVGVLTGLIKKYSKRTKMVAVACFAVSVVISALIFNVANIYYVQTGLKAIAGTAFGFLSSLFRKSDDG